MEGCSFAREEFGFEFSSVILEVVNRNDNDRFLILDYRKVSSPFLSLPFSFCRVLIWLVFQFFHHLIVEEKNVLRKLKRVMFQSYCIRNKLQLRGQFGIGSGRIGKTTFFH